MAFSVVELCRQRSITVPQLAEQSGLDEGRTLAILLGRWTPSPDERSKIAKVLGVEPAEIAWGHQIPVQHLYGHGPG